MPFLLSLIKNPKFIVYAMAFILAFGGGFYTRSVLYKASQTGKLESQLKKANEGSKKIIEFNSKWGAANVKDDCVDKPIPNAYRLLLNR